MTLDVQTSGWLDVAFSAQAGTTIAVVGPNGAGKTTLLRAVAGLPSTATADVHLDGRDMGSRPAHLRGVGWVPQSGLLFPHLDALSNAAYGARTAGRSRKDARDLALEWLDRLGVAEFAGRRPGRLSGGEQQRVALARAFAAEPALLLLDEPLSSLDSTTRAGTRSLLRRHLTSYDGVCLLVTHDVVEAVALADRMLVLDGGRVVQDAPPAEVTRSPRSRWVAELFGWNAFTGVTTAHGLAVAGFELIAAEPLQTGLDALACIGPGTVALHRTRPAGSPRNAWPGTVSEVVPSGSRLRVTVVSPGGGPDLVAEVTPSAAAELELVEGTAVWVSVKATEVSLAAL